MNLHGDSGEIPIGLKFWLMVGLAMLAWGVLLGGAWLLVRAIRGLAWLLAHGIL